MKIYFAGSIRGGRDDADLYKEIITILKNYGEVLTEHVGDKDLEITDDLAEHKRIYQYDVELMSQSDIMVAEVSTTSLGVGYEIAKFEDKPVLCLVKETVGSNLSSMISGNPNCIVKPYKDIDNAGQIIGEFFSDL